MHLWDFIQLVNHRALSSSALRNLSHLLGFPCLIRGFKTLTVSKPPGKQYLGGTKCHWHKEILTDVFPGKAVAWFHLIPEIFVVMSLCSWEVFSFPSLRFSSCPNEVHFHAFSCSRWAFYSMCFLAFSGDLSQILEVFKTEI